MAGCTSYVPSRSDGFSCIALLHFVMTIGQDCTDIYIVDSALGCFLAANQSANEVFQVCHASDILQDKRIFLLLVKSSTRISGMKTTDDGVDNVQSKGHCTFCISLHRGLSALKGDSPCHLREREREGEG